MSNYDLLIQKLDSFIRKFYFNKLLKGLLYTVAFIIGLFLILNLLEHNFYFKTGVRKVLFFGFVGISLASLTFWVLTPLAKYFRLGKVIDHEQAALIIGDHFGSVKDKLLNILQLKNQDHGTASEALIRASIEQKTEDIKLVPFRSAIDLSSNKKYLKYALPPAMLLLVLLFAAPSLITEPTHRLINNNKEFEKDAPFHFHINNQDLDVIQFEDKVISVDVDGEEIPDEVFINVDDFQYRMKKQDATSFSYTFKDVQKDIDFHFFSGRVKSSDHELNVLLRPNLTEFQLYLNYPDYLRRKDERLSNRGDMFIPEGTVVTWNFKTENTDEVYLKFASESNPRVAEKKSEVDYRISRNIKKDDSYKLYIANENIPTPDSIGYTINVIPDQHPEIKAESFVDSLEKTLIYFVGNASDDHGLTSLNFQYTVTNSSGTRKTDILPLQKPTAREMQFNHTFDLTELELKPGDKVSYFFETKDNDGVNGPKSAKTNLMEFEKPSLEEFEDMENINEEEIKDKLEEALKESKEIQEALKKLREKMLQKQEPDWEDKKELEKLLERQKELNEELKEAKEKFKENIKNQEEFTKRDEELLEKQERLEELFEEATNDETEQLMEKIQELMEELNKDQMLEQMEEMRMDDQEQEMEMDRLLELFKNLEVEKEMQDMIEKLEEMAEQQEELAKETEEEKKSQDQLEKEQEELNKEMEDLEKKNEELEKKNEELERPKDMGEENEEKMEDIQEDMKESSEKMEQKDNKGASQKQKQAAEKMKKMASAMQSAMDSDQKQQMEEDIKALRQLLENLVNLSFDQEDLHDSFRRTQYYTPKYVELTASQHDLKDDFSLIQDSLFALAKRNDKIQPFVTEKVTVINDEMGKNLENLVCESCLNKSQKDNSFADAKAGQRTIMKNVNDLALMLSESMEQMQQQMSGMMSGNQMCNKPGGSGGKDGKVPMDKISEGQKDLNDGLKKQAEQGKQGDGKNGMSAKDFAQAAARQAALRKALEELAQEKSEQGKGSKELQDIIEGMDQIETDLVNKKLDNQLLMRQQDILTRLLQAEKADRQRDKDNKRKAERGKDQKKELPPALQEYLKEREAEIEMYKKVSPSLRPFYKQLVDEYYKALKSR